MSDLEYEPIDLGTGKMLSLDEAYGVYGAQRVDDVLSGGHFVVKMLMDDVGQKIEAHDKLCGCGGGAQMDVAELLGVLRAVSDTYAVALLAVREQAVKR